MWKFKSNYLLYDSICLKCQMQINKCFMNVIAFYPYVGNARFTSRTISITFTYTFNLSHNNHSFPNGHVLHLVVDFIIRLVLDFIHAFCNGRLLNLVVDFKRGVCPTLVKEKITPCIFKTRIILTYYSSTPILGFVQFSLRTQLICHIAFMLFAMVEYCTSWSTSKFDL